jgi:UDP-galactopyranose mutase
MVDYDFLIVGAGLSGSTLAERLANNGKKVLVVEKRAHIAGNVFDCHDEHGILIHKYGPHLFHTNSKEVFDYLSNFTEWMKYEHKVLAYIEGKQVPVPINRTTLNMLYGLDLKTDEEAAAHFEKVREKNIKVNNAEDAVVSKVGYDLHRKLFEGYTKKQWGTDPKNLSAEITQRIPVRVNTDDRYFTDVYQAIPKEGYTKMVEKMLSHPGITVMLNTDYKTIADKVSYSHMIYTGPLDYYFDYKYGKLRYRSLSFEYKTHDAKLVQKVAQINYPDVNVPYTRTFETKHVTGQQHGKTTVGYEFPQSEGEPYYPMLTTEDKALFERYKADATKQEKVSFVGRLADFKYYNMDQTVAAALQLYNRLPK